jgi:hypothetical protein
VREIKLLEFVFREGLFDLRREHRPVVQPEVVNEQESATEAVFPHPRKFLLREMHIAHLTEVGERVLIEFLVAKGVNDFAMVERRIEL